MTAKLRGALMSVDQLMTAIDKDADGLAARVEGLHVRRQDVIAKANKGLDATKTALDGVEAMFTDLEKGNGSGGSKEPPKPGAQDAEKPTPETSAVDQTPAPQTTDAGAAAPAGDREPPPQEPAASWAGPKT